MEKILIGTLFLARFSSCRYVKTDDCGIPGEPFGGTFHPKKKIYNINDNVTYNCEDEFIFYGSDSGRMRTCGPNNAWTGEIPLCLSPHRTAIKQICRLDRRIRGCADGKPFQDRNPWSCFNVYGLKIIFTRFVTIAAVRLNYQSDVYLERLTNASRSPFVIRSVEKGDCKQYLGINVMERAMFVTFFCDYVTTDEILIMDSEPEEDIALCEVEFFLIPFGPSSSSFENNVRCKTPDNPVNGYSTVSTESQYADYHCNPGYRPQSSLTLCSTMGEWLYKPFPCLEYVGFPENIPTSTTTVSRLTVTSTATRSQSEDHKASKSEDLPDLPNGQPTGISKY